MRSKLFRTLLVVNLDQLLSLSVGFRRNQPLPAPAAVATILRSKAIEFLEKWNASFGIHYKQLRLGFDYLKNTLRFQFPNLQANAARIQQERKEREIRSKEILLKKFEALKEKFSSMKEEIQSTIDEIRECLDIVRTKEENLPLDIIEDEEMEEFHGSELRQIRLDSLKEAEKVHENNDNKVVFDALRELYKLLVTRHLVSTQESISVLIRVEVADNRSRDSMLKELIDIRNHILSVKIKCEESSCALANTINDEEEDIWEEGRIEPTKNGNSATVDNQSKDHAQTSTSSRTKSKAPERSNKESGGNKRLGRESNESDSTSLRNQLLDEAPVMNWGCFLDNWGSKQDFMANQRGLEVYGHWGRVDYDAVIPAEKIAELNIQATVYKEEPVDIQPCRTPLRKGGLCQRRDLRVCPFHGPIIPRDDEGKPILQRDDEGKPVHQQDDEGKPMHQNTSTEERIPDLGPDLLEKLAKQAVKNVRDRDKEETKKREYDKHALKRAKLAKVREHNESVLREAAIASTSRSEAFGEDLGANSLDKPVARNKKQTLASMLRKKITTKDRLGQKLLNTRVRDETIRQVTQSEDANYREAFPNQW